MVEKDVPTASPDTKKRMVEARLRASESKLKKQKGLEMAIEAWLKEQEAKQYKPPVPEVYQYKVGEEPWPLPKEGEVSEERRQELIEAEFHRQIEKQRRYNERHKQ